MADDTSNKPYPLQFDPSQWTNPYSQFYGKALPWPSSYAGVPTDAMGNPIAVPQGMTLNSTPAQPQAPAAAAPPQAPIQHATMQPQSPLGTPVYGNIGRVSGGIIGYAQQPQQQQFPQQPQAAPQAAAPAGNNWQTTLAMLANPGKVTTPGATVPQAQNATSIQPGVLQNFLANWQPAQSGPGSGFTQNFNTILRGLQAQKGS